MIKKGLNDREIITKVYIEFMYNLLLWAVKLAGGRKIAKD